MVATAYIKCMIDFIAFKLHLPRLPLSKMIRAVAAFFERGIVICIMAIIDAVGVQVVYLFKSLQLLIRLLC